MTTLLKGGRVVDPQNGIDEVKDILIRDHKIAAVGNVPLDNYTEVIDVTGLAILPGLVDMHVHLRDPGLTHKEDIITGTRAAAAGGFTAVLCMPNTVPTIDSEQVVSYIREKAKEGSAKVYVTGAISTELQGNQLTDFDMLKSAGVIALSDDGRPVENAALMAEALQRAELSDLLITSHCEDLKIINGGLINDGKVSRELGIAGMHRSSEDSITARDIILAETHGCRIHIAHVSTALSVQLIREAKARGVRVTAETCPHYFMMTEEMVRTQDADYRMNPPLREEADRIAVLEGVLDGTLDCIVTDHAPHTPQEKADFLKAPNGVIGMETSFAASYTALVKTGRLTLSQLVQRMSQTPSRILGISGGHLSLGKVADITVVDLTKEWTPNPEELLSKARNCIFKGVPLTGQVQLTFLDGKCVYKHPSFQAVQEEE